MKKYRQLDFNRKAPDLTLQNTSGDPVQLSSLWAQKPLLLAFARHFGCTQCKEMLSMLVAGKEQLEKAGLQVVAVMQGTPETSAAFAGQFAPGILCLADPERNAYHAYGLERGNLFQTFLNPKIWSAVSKSVKKGYKVELPPKGQDTMQLAGIFIISKEGKIELPYYFDDIADHPPLELLLNGVLSTRWDHSFNGPVGPGAALYSRQQEEKE